LVFTHGCGRKKNGKVEVFEIGLAIKPSEKRFGRWMASSPLVKEMLSGDNDNDNHNDDHHHNHNDNDNSNKNKNKNKKKNNDNHSYDVNNHTNRESNDNRR
jgi:hypothetical protein